MGPLVVESDPTPLFHSMSPIAIAGVGNAHMGVVKVGMVPNVTSLSLVPNHMGATVHGTPNA